MTNPTPEAPLGSAALTWSGICPPDASCHYTHTSAQTPLGRFLLTWKSWKDDPGYGFDETPWGEVVYLGWDSVESAQQWAAEELSRRARLCIETQLPALRAAAEKALAAWERGDERWQVYLAMRELREQLNQMK